MSSAPIPKPQPERLDYLDSLRGIAAILVLLHHAYQTAPFWPSAIRLTPARILLNGRSSVIFFFVLSGFVLAYGLWRGDQSMTWSTFLWRRLARIYLPYLAAAVLALGALLAIQPTALADAGVTFNEMWLAPPTWSAALAHLSLMGTNEAKAINSPSWSLVYELRISLLIPLLYVLVVRAPRLLGLAALGCYVLCDLALYRLGCGLTPYAASGLLPNVVVTLHFTADFVIGIYLARATLRRAAWLTEMQVTTKVVLGLVAAALLLVFRDETAAVGSAIVLMLAVGSPAFQRVLRRPLLLWIGRVSFSLYLTHMIVLEIVVRALHGVVPLHVSVALALLAILPCTVLFHRWVEEPAARLSRRIGRPYRAAAGALVPAVG